MASSLLISDNKRIITTLAKAKALRKYIEPVITKSKVNTTHSRRTAFRYLRNKDAARILFGEVAAAVADRPGGYTRILKLGPRKGDNAEMALIELPAAKAAKAEAAVEEVAAEAKETAAEAAAEATEPEVEAPEKNEEGAAGE
ncbi:UNVERIFIED_CONTAM: hypothetical protein GTU68_003510 [Idotea baltica]|nr:hypothetical protein [Idotea baltica]